MLPVLLTVIQQQMNITKDEKNVLNRNNSESGKNNNQTSILKSLMFCTLNQRLQLIEQTLCVNNIDDKYRVLDNALFFNIDKL
jgi:hypothetical protein